MVFFGIILPFIAVPIYVMYLIAKGNIEDERRRKEEEEKISQMTEEERIRYYKNRGVIDFTLQNNLPIKCPSCNKFEPGWQQIDQQKMQEFDSAVSIGAYTQINTKNRYRTRWKCRNCGYEIYRET